MRHWVWILDEIQEHQEKHPTGQLRILKKNGRRRLQQEVVGLVDNKKYWVDVPEVTDGKDTRW